MAGGGFCEEPVDDVPVDVPEFEAVAISDIAALAVLVGSAKLVAITVMV